MVTALFTVSYDVPVTDPDLMGHLEPLERAVQPTHDAGIQVELGGDLPDTAAAPMTGRGELIGEVSHDSGTSCPGSDRRSGGRAEPALPASSARAATV